MSHRDPRDNPNFGFNPSKISHAYKCVVFFAFTRIASSFSSHEYTLPFKKYEFTNNKRFSGGNPHRTNLNLIASHLAIGPQSIHDLKSFLPTNAHQFRTISCLKLADNSYDPNEENGYDESHYSADSYEGQTSIRGRHGNDWVNKNTRRVMDELAKKAAEENTTPNVPLSDGSDPAANLEKYLNQESGSKKKGNKFQQEMKLFTEPNYASQNGASDLLNHIKRKQSQLQSTDSSSNDPPSSSSKLIDRLAKRNPHQSNLGIQDNADKSHSQILKDAYKRRRQGQKTFGSNFNKHPNFRFQDNADKSPDKILKTNYGTRTDKKAAPAEKTDRTGKATEAFLHGHDLNRNIRDGFNGASPAQDSPYNRQTDHAVKNNNVPEGPDFRSFRGDEGQLGSDMIDKAHSVHPNSYNSASPAQDSLYNRQTDHAIRNKNVPEVPDFRNFRSDEDQLGSDMIDEAHSVHPSSYDSFDEGGYVDRDMIRDYNLGGPDFHSPQGQIGQDNMDVVDREKHFIEGEYIDRETISNISPEGPGFRSSVGQGGQINRGMDERGNSINEGGYIDRDMIRDYNLGGPDFHSYQGHIGQDNIDAVDRDNHFSEGEYIDRETISNNSLEGPGYRRSVGQGGQINRGMDKRGNHINEGEYIEEDMVSKNIPGIQDFHSYQGQIGQDNMDEVDRKFYFSEGEYTGKEIFSNISPEGSGFHSSVGQGRQINRGMDERRNSINEGGYVDRDMIRDYNLGGPDFHSPQGQIGQDNMDVVDREIHFIEGEYIDRETISNISPEGPGFRSSVGQGGQINRGMDERGNSINEGGYIDRDMIRDYNLGGPDFLSSQGQRDQEGQNNRRIVDRRNPAASGSHNSFSEGVYTDKNMVNNYGQFDRNVHSYRDQTDQYKRDMIDGGHLAGSPLHDPRNEMNGLEFGVEDYTENNMIHEDVSGVRYNENYVDQGGYMNQNMMNKDAPVGNEFQNAHDRGDYMGFREMNDASLNDGNTIGEERRVGDHNLYDANTSKLGNGRKYEPGANVKGRRLDKTDPQIQKRQNLKSLNNLEQNKSSNMRTPKIDQHIHQQQKAKGRFDLRSPGLSQQQDQINKRNAELQNQQIGNVKETMAIDNSGTQEVTEEFPHKTENNLFGMKAALEFQKKLQKDEKEGKELRKVVPKAKVNTEKLPKTNFTKKKVDEDIIKEEFDLDNLDTIQTRAKQEDDDIFAKEEIDLDSWEQKRKEKEDTQTEFDLDSVILNEQKHGNKDNLKSNPGSCMDNRLNSTIEEIPTELKNL